MAYNKEKFQLTHLLQDAWQRMGQLKIWKATGGSTTTVINTGWAGIEDEIFEDDDSALIYGTVVVVRDAGLAGAAPEGEFGEITDYDSASQTITMSALTTAVASGDKIGIASPLFPLNDMMELANIAIRKLGEIDIVDTSISVVSAQTDYTLPATIQKNPFAVYARQSNGVTKKINFTVTPATPGSNWTLVIPNSYSGDTLDIWYRSLHPEFTAFDSSISEVIHPELATCALIAEAFQWYNNKVGGTNEYFLQRENKAMQDLAQAKVDYPIYRRVEQFNGFPHWRRDNNYIPLTNDLRA